jgi:lipopolysaccharide/colanic/teichoic acid biosynthesis glycosyltransferase
VLFRQERVGQNGELFTLLKFRSLRPATAQESGQLWSVKDDDRMGPVGRFIRKTSLDELPQLLNVLRGHMSIIGPRPERPFFVEQFVREHRCYALRHRVRPGLTGWAAVNGLRGDTSIEDRVYFDNAYIDNWSLWLDIKIVFRTLGAVVAGRGG